MERPNVLGEQACSTVSRPGSAGSALLILALAGCASAPVAPEGDPPAGETIAASSLEPRPVSRTDGPGRQEDAPAPEAPATGEPEPQEGAPPGDAPTAASEESGAAAAAPPEGGEVAVDGFLTTRYRGRWAAGESDQNLISIFDVHVGDPEQDAVSGHVGGRVHWNVNGRRAPDSLFFDIWDTYDGDVEGLIYDAYVDANEVPGLTVARLGRQSTYDTPVYLVFDGVRVESQELAGSGLRLGAYGGVPVHFFESSQEGALYGANLDVRPWKGGRLRLDWMHLDEEAVMVDHDNDLLGIKLWQEVTDRLRLTGEYTMLEEESRDFALRADYVDPEANLTVNASYYQLLEPLRSLALELDPFFDSLLTYFPFARVGLQASKGIGERLVLQGGADFRQVSDEDDTGQFNRDYDRYYLTASVLDAFTEGLTISLTGDLWDSDDREVDALALDATQEFDEKLRASLGTYYSLYKYDAATNSEQDDVRTYYAKVGYRKTKALSFDVGYDYEDNAFADFQIVIVGVTWRF